MTPRNARCHLPTPASYMYRPKAKFH